MPDPTPAELLADLRRRFRSTRGLPLTAEQAARLPEALEAKGLPFLWLAQATDTLWAARMIEAALSQDGLMLHDPLEDHPDHAERIRAIRQEAAEQVTGSQGPYLGSCFAIWDAMATRLKLEHGLVWFSPAEMNPFVLFD